MYFFGLVTVPGFIPISVLKWKQSVQAIFIISALSAVLFLGFPVLQIHNSVACIILPYVIFIITLFLKYTVCTR